jgi:hypothetical protein
LAIPSVLDVGGAAQSDVGLQVLLPVLRSPGAIQHTKELEEHKSPAKQVVQSATRTGLVVAGGGEGAGREEEGGTVEVVEGREGEGLLVDLGGVAQSEVGLQVLLPVLRSPGAIQHTKELETHKSPAKQVVQSATRTGLVVAGGGEGAGKEEEVGTVEVVEGREGGKVEAGTCPSHLPKPDKHPAPQCAAETPHQLNCEQHSVPPHLVPSVPPHLPFLVTGIVEGGGGAGAGGEIGPGSGEVGEAGGDDAPLHLPKLD